MFNDPVNYIALVWRYQYSFFRYGNPQKNNGFGFLFPPNINRKKFAILAISTVDLKPKIYELIVGQGSIPKNTYLFINIKCSDK